MTMYVVEHNCPFVESITTNGVAKQINYHIKASPFTYKLSLRGDSSFNFSRGSLTAELFFDALEPKPVQQENPFEYLMYASDNGKSCSLQFRIHLLSTQNQGMLFKIRVRLTCGQRFVETWTDSIKVVAKLDSIRKKQAEIQGTTLPKKNHKRPRADDLLDTLASIQERQHQQTELLNNLLVRMNSMSPCSPLPSSPSADSDLPSPTPLSLESAFEQFLEVYAQVDPNDRPRKLQKLVHLCPKFQVEAEELGCVLADMTDSPSAKVEVKVEDEEHSQAQDSPVHEPTPDTFGFTEEQLGDFCSDSELISSMSSTDLETWNIVLQEFMMTDKPTQ